MEKPRCHVLSRATINCVPLMRVNSADLLRVRDLSQSLASSQGGVTRLASVFGFAVTALNVHFCISIE
jgi:hypothetical protein